MSLDIIHVLVEVIQIAVILGFQLIRIKVFFCHQGGVAGHGVGVADLLDFIEASKARLVLLAQLRTTGLDIAQLLVCFLVVDQDGGLNPLKQDESGETAEDRGEHPRDGNSANPAPLHHVQAALAGDEADGERGADDAANDGVSGRHRPTHTGGNEEPDGRTQKGRHHDVDELHGVEPIDGVKVDDAGTHGIGNLAAGEDGAGDLEDGGDDEGLLHGQRPGTYGGAEGVGNVIAANIEGHEKSEENGSAKENGLRAIDVVVAPDHKTDEGNGGKAAKDGVPNPVVALAIDGLNVRHLGGRGRHRKNLSGKACTRGMTALLSVVKRILKGNSYVENAHSD